MGSLEALTKEELIGWIRENHPDMDEEDLAIKILDQQLKNVWKYRDEADDRRWDIENQIRELIEEHSDGPIKPGMRLKRWSAAAQAKYNELDQQRQQARKESREWWARDKETFQRLMDLQQQRINRFTAIAEEAIKQAQQAARKGE